MVKFRSMIHVVMLVTLLIIANGCKPDRDSDVRVTTYTPQSITTTTVNCGGDVIVTQGLVLNELGVCWSTNRNPTVEDTCLSTSIWNKPFTCTITGLDPGTVYHVRAFALRGLEYYYGEDVKIKTLSGDLPTVITSEVNNITVSSAVCSGVVTNDGNLPVVERGLCWSTNPNPTIDDDFEIGGSGLGSFTIELVGLEQNTTYYVRAYAKNYYGVSYGSIASFTTYYGELPTVTTSEVTDVTWNSAIGGGEVVSDGGLSILERGLCWSTNPNPTIDDTHANNGSGLGPFALELNDLFENTTYYVRAYAKNYCGIGYGSQVCFSTLTSCDSWAYLINETPHEAIVNGNTMQYGFFH